MILVIGDVMLDEWVFGNVNRISPEAPIPIVDFDHKEHVLGGAGNVVNNLKALGADVSFITGLDDHSETSDIIANLLSDVCLHWRTFNIPESFLKQRICSGQQQIVRIDTGIGKNISDIEIENMLNYVDEDNIDCIVISDYGKGAITETVLHDATEFCIERGIPLLVDPYDREYYYTSVFQPTLIKFNKKEAENFLPTDLKLNHYDNIVEAGRILKDTFDSESFLITMGEKGMYYFDKHHFKREPLYIPADHVNVYDVCGAGDSVISAMAFLLQHDYYKANMTETLTLASRAGRIAVSKKGTAVVTYDELFPRGRKE